MRLGDANRADAIVSYGVNGTIIDNKSYKDGFSINRGSADEMCQYINENVLRSTALNPNKWWENFDSGVTVYTFLFITSYLKGGFEKQLEYISTANSGIKGAAIGVESLLYFAEGMKSRKYKGTFMRRRQLTLKPAYFLGEMPTAFVNALKKLL